MTATKCVLHRAQTCASSKHTKNAPCHGMQTMSSSMARTLILTIPRLIHSNFGLYKCCLKYGQRECPAHFHCKSSCYISSLRSLLARTSCRRTESISKLTLGWCSMREAGERTPDIAMWQKLPSAQPLSTLNLKKFSFPKVLTLYNTPCVPLHVLPLIHGWRACR